MQFGNSQNWITLKAGVPKEVAGILLGANAESLPGKPTGQYGGDICVPLGLDVETPLPFKFFDLLTVESDRSFEQ